MNKKEGNARIVAKNYNIIELNGNRYDAITGVLLDPHTTAPKRHGSSASAHKAAPSTSVMRRGNGTTVDGIISHAITTLTPIPVKPIPKLGTAGAKGGMAHPSKPLTPHKPEHSKTLMRHAVHVPKIVPKKPLKIQAPTDLVKHQPAVLTVKPKRSSDQIDDTRAIRAKQIPRSNVVKRFHRPTRLVSAQSPAAAQHPAVQPARPAVHNTNGIPTLGQRNNTSAALLDRAVTAATSHTQVAPKESRRHKTNRFTKRHVKLFSITAMAFAMLILGGFIAYQNKASLELQLASTKAGFHATMPSYKPVGFAVKKLTYSPGTVTIGFGSSVKSFTVTQKQSNWDSETLLENYVATSGSAYQAYSAAGRTIYIYGNGAATWVNGGVWYQINGNAKLNNTQIIDLAASM